MNADFERDKGTYPYGPTRRGDSYYLCHIPTQVIPTEGILHGLGLPENVVIRAANKLNSLYYARDEEGLRDALNGVADIIRASARELNAEGSLQSVHLSQINELLDNAPGATD